MRTVGTRRSRPGTGGRGCLRLSVGVDRRGGGGGPSGAGGPEGVQWGRPSHGNRAVVLPAAGKGPSGAPASIAISTEVASVKDHAMRKVAKDRPTHPAERGPTASETRTAARGSGRWDRRGAGRISRRGAGGDARRGALDLYRHSQTPRWPRRGGATDTAVGSGAEPFVARRSGRRGYGRDLRTRRPGARAAAPPHRRVLGARRSRTARVRHSTRAWHAHVPTLPAGGSG